MNPSQSNIENGDNNSDTPVDKRDYKFCGNRIPKNQFTYLSQIIVIYAIIATAIVHLSLQSDNRELWLILLSSSLGYILPSPGLKFVKQNPSSSFDLVNVKK